MIDREHDLPLTKQAKTLNISRRSLYYVPELVRPADLALMRQMDKLHLEFPFAGSRMLRDLLAADGSKVGRRHVTTLMRKMGHRSGLSQAQHIETRAGPQESFRICCVGSQSVVQTKSGRQTSPTFRWRAASSICAP